jgi:phosphonopyruvate decarboxylase
MQNSGLPNALNPLMALTSVEAFDIPLVLVIGWRGRPGLPDEPQHIRIGKATIDLLSAAGIEPYLVETASDMAGLPAYLSQLSSARVRGAVLVSPAATKGASPSPAPKGDSRLRKADVLQMLLAVAEPRAVFVSGIGHTAREMMALRQARGEDEFSDMPAVGGMGFASLIAAGLALGGSDRRVYCIDGDGSFLMHAGNHAVIGSRPDLPFTHIVLDNGCHASVGGHPIANRGVMYVPMARALGYPWATTAATLEEFASALREHTAKGGAGLIHVPIESSTPTALPRPPRSLAEGLATFRAVYEKSSS